MCGVETRDPINLNGVALTLEKASLVLSLITVYITTLQTCYEVNGVEEKVMIVLKIVTRVRKMFMEHPRTGYKLDSLVVTY